MTKKINTKFLKFNFRVEGYQRRYGQIPAKKRYKDLTDYNLLLLRCLDGRNERIQNGLSVTRKKRAGALPFF